MRIAVVGAGAMGRTLADIIEEKASQGKTKEKFGREGIKLAGMIETLNGKSLGDLEAETGIKPDVVIDFSNPANLEMIAEYTADGKIPLVIATTGFSDAQLKKIEELSKRIPVVFSANYSLGIAVMKKILIQITPVLKDAFDIEVLEKHHNRKADAPSGTAKMLTDILDPEGQYDKKYGRVGIGLRGHEIGIHAVRGGSIAGEHTVMFAGDDEILEIKHTALSKKIFALGALEAAAFVYEKSADGEKGMFTIEDVVFRGKGCGSM